MYKLTDLKRMHAPRKPNDLKRKDMPVALTWNHDKSKVMFISPATLITGPKRAPAIWAPSMTLGQMKRLHRWLERAIAYLESKK